jgi:acetoin utilization deacetylase AcuC-like enzyme
MSERIATFYSPHHELHAPQVEFLHGQLIPYFEMPTRIETIKAALLEAQLIDLHISEMQINREDALVIHDAKLIDYIIETSANCEQLVRDEFAIYHLADQVHGDEYIYANIFPPRHMPNHTGYLHFITDNVSPIGKHTWQAVTASASLAKQGAQALLGGASHAIALCRPPGHHAGHDFTGGYCYINNAALAAHHLKQKGRVAILDVDYHHGNGTQSVFWDDSEVMVISLHITPDHDYPYFSGTVDEKGSPHALGANLNYPLAPHTPAEIYLKTVEDALAQIRAFGAQSLVVSLGYDIYLHDQMGTFTLEVEHFEQLGRLIGAVALPILVVQEGGYTVEALGELAVAFVKGMQSASS